MAKLPNVSELDSCPYCGNTTYYYLSSVSGHITTWVNFDGSEADSTEMYNSLGSKPLKYVHCSNCHKKIAQNDVVQQ